MENSIIKLRDENGNILDGKVLNIIEIDNIEYLLYAVSESNDQDGLYVKKIVSLPDGDEDLVDIVDETEKDKVYSLVREYVNSIE